MRERKGGKVRRLERWFDLFDEGLITFIKGGGVGLGFYHNRGDMSRRERGSGRGFRHFELDTEWVVDKFNQISTNVRLQYSF
jgi:hypothetical protein